MKNLCLVCVKKIEKLNNILHFHLVYIPYSLLGITNKKMVALLTIFQLELLPEPSVIRTKQVQKLIARYPC